MTATRNPIQIDRDKLRAAVRKLGSEYVFYVLDDAIELLPPAKLHRIAKKYLDLERLRPDAEQAATPNLLTDVKRFEKASLAGEYYESFFVNSQNYRQQSARREAMDRPRPQPCALTKLSMGATQKAGASVSAFGKRPTSTRLVNFC